MSFADVAGFFNNDPLYDGYTGDYLYDGQFATYNESQLGAAFNRRRTLELSPTYALPPRRVVESYGERWVLAEPIFDGFMGEVVRQTMSARKVEGLFSVLTAAELVLGSQPARTFYAYMRWTKGTVSPETTAEEPYHEFSISLTEDFIGKKFLKLGNRVWSPRLEAIVAEGFKMIEADEIVTEGSTDHAVTVASLGEADPVTLNQTVSATYPGLLVKRYNFFQKSDEASQDIYVGDRTLVIAKSSEPDPKGALLVNADLWNILARQDLDDGWALHVRKVG